MDNAQANDPAFALLLFAVMLDRAGGSAEISDADLQAVAFKRLQGGKRADGMLVFMVSAPAMADGAPAPAAPSAEPPRIILPS